MLVCTISQIEGIQELKQILGTDETWCNYSCDWLILRSSMQPKVLLAIVKILALCECGFVFFQASFCTNHR